MSKQSEAILEEQLVAQLKMLGYGYALINSEKDLIHRDEINVAYIIQLLIKVKTHGHASQQNKKFSTC